MIIEYRKKTIEELKLLVVDKEKEVQDIAMKILKDKEKNVKKVTVIKKDIARILTVIKEKEKENA